MRDLRVDALSEDGTHLVLVGATADSRTVERFRVSVDDRLHAALRGELGRVGQQQIRLESSLRPREIQDRLRAGQPLTEVARIAGVPPERVERFAGPVFAERALVVERARRGTVTALDGVGAGVTLGDVVTGYARRAEVGAAAISWDSWRLSDRRWIVQVAVPGPGGPTTARFLWDPEIRRVTPYDGSAALLAPGSVAPEEPAPAEPLPAEPVRVEPVPVEPIPAVAPVTAPVAPGSAEWPGGEAAGGGEPGRAAGRSVGRRGTVRRGRRATVPSWADVLLGQDPSAG